MSKISPWVNAARLRTLPLSISGIVVGAALANLYGEQDIFVFFLALFTTIAFQITSNFANDYGDGVKGTDNEDRVGPKRALQSGLLSRKALKKGIVITIGISLILVITLLYYSFGMKNSLYFLVFIFLALFGIWAAVKYTVGKSAYGYRGLGDIFVFIFFGLVAVLGTLFLYTKYVTLLAFLPAIAIGALSVGVLNLNNLRDYYSDKKAGKNTLIVKIGIKKGKKYHYFLIALSFISILIFIVTNFKTWYNCIPLCAFIPIFLHFKRVFHTRDSKLLDPELKKLALSTFLLAILFYTSCYNFL